MYSLDAPELFTLVGGGWGIPIGGGICARATRSPLFSKRAPGGGTVQRIHIYTYRHENRATGQKNAPDGAILTIPVCFSAAKSDFIVFFQWKSQFYTQRIAPSDQ